MMDMPNNNYTLITGASSGLGKEFAIQCARMDRNIILVALPGSHLQSVADNLMLEYQVQVKVFEFDLSNSQLLKETLQRMTELYDIDFLINNAGVGGTSPITHTSRERIDDIIMLNVRSTVLLTHQLLPHLLRHSQSYIMNIASMAAFTPIAYKTVYPASKAFISSFSLGLKEEMANTSLSVSVVDPGPIMTNSHTSRRVISQGIKGKMGLLSTPAIARMALKKTLAGKPVIIPGMMNKINHALMQLLPLSVKMRIVSREVKKEIPYALSV